MHLYVSTDWSYCKGPQNTSTTVFQRIQRFYGRCPHIKIQMCIQEWSYCRDLLNSDTIVYMCEVQISPIAEVHRTQVHLYLGRQTGLIADVI